jgi:molecular chaperone GrpE
LKEKVMSKQASHHDKEPLGPDGAEPAAKADPAPQDAPDGAAGTDASGPEAGGAGQTGGQDPSPEGRIAELEAQLADSAAQLADARDQMLRKAADFENFRKRMNREKQDAIDFANQSLLSDLIPILDDFDRALQSAHSGAGGSAASSKDFESLYEGVGMIAKRLSAALDSKWGLKGYVSAGEVFDPNRHEALMMEKSSAVDEQIVQMDLVKGYTLKDRVIRSAKVKVLVPDPAAPAIPAPAAGAPANVSVGVDFNGAASTEAAESAAAN